MKRIYLLFVLFVSLFISCTNNGANSKISFTEYTDSYNRRVCVPKHPKRIISVSPGITEIIYSLNCDSLLIGRSDFCNYPKEALNVESVGGISNVNVEKIFSLNPDLVLIGSMVPQKTVETLEKASIAVFAIKEEASFEGVFTSLHTLGTILNKSHIAQQQINSIKKELNSIKATNNRANKPSVYYVVGYGQAGDYTAGANTHINDIINLAGGKNIAQDNASWSFSRELLFKRNPDFIFVRAEDFNAFCNTFPYTNLSAVKEKRVFPIESAWMDVLGPRSIEAVKYISEKIHNKQ